jgi:cobalt-zinc-cadmium efflux system outer membrane protein
MQKHTFSLLFVLCFATSFLRAETKADSVHLTLADAEKMFVTRNLSLIAQKYNIDINKALVQQAKYWQNPTITVAQNLNFKTIYQGLVKEDNLSHGGQLDVQLQQVILTAGKRNKLIHLANDQVLTAEQQFNDLLRNLSFVLHTTMNTLYQQQATYKLFMDEEGSLEQMVTAMDAEFKAGNISQKENIRVKALLYSLQTDQASLQTQMADSQRDLKILLQMGGDSTIVVDMPEINANFGSPLPLIILQDTARATRPDYLLTQTAVLSQQHNLAYQKALVAPDVTVGVEYDHASSYQFNYWGLGVGLPLPILNRNKGNINAAQKGIEQAQVQVTQYQSQIDREVEGAYNKWLISQKIVGKALGVLDQPYDNLLQNMMKSYKEKQVSLIEFVDFFDSYKETKSNRMEQELNLRNAIAELNFTVGKNIIQ